MGGDLSVGGTAVITGNIDANGDADIAGALTLSKAIGTGLAVTANATVGGTLGVSGATTVGETLGVTGATTLSSTLGVGGLATFSDHAIVTKDLTVTNRLFAAGGIASDVAVNTNKFTVAAATGNTAVAGTLGVTGVTTLSLSLIHI